MKQILHTYKLRLTNINQGNRALRLAKLSSRRDIDLTALGFVEKENTEEIFQKILSGKKISLIQQLDPRWERLNLANQQLNLLHREVQHLYEEMGTHDLYVGYPFVEGKFADGTTVRCPILLFPVELVRNLQNQPRWQLLTPANNEILWNTTFFLAYELYQQQRIAKEFWEETIEYNEDWNVFLTNLYELLKKYEIQVNFNSKLFEKKIEPFFPYTKEVLESFPVGKLIFQSQAVLGIFPQSDSALLQDYELIEREPERFPIGNYFEKSAFFETQNPTTHLENEALKCYITDIDGSQETVLEKAKQGNSLVIYGPPGTGKSQVIVNLIADALAEGKKILVVSQKRAALDVVYKRLSANGLANYSALIHDQQTDRSNLFSKLHRQIEQLPELQKSVLQYEREPLQYGFDTLAQELNQNKAFFEDLYQALTQTQPYGCPIYHLYVNYEPSENPLSFISISENFSLSDLKKLNQKIIQLLDYTDFFQEAYIWRERVDFSAYNYQSKFEIQTKMENIYPTIQTLQKTYNSLKENLGSDLLDTLKNQTQLAAYRNTLNHLQTPQIEKGIASLEKDNRPSEEIQVSLQKLQTQVQAFKNLQILAGLTWEDLVVLLAQLNIYQTKKSDLLRLFSAEYKQAVKFIEKVLHSKNKTWNEITYENLLAETRIFQSFLSFKEQIIGYSFYQDFPKENIWENLENWKFLKNKQFLAWKEMKEISVYPSLKPLYLVGVLHQDAWQNSQNILQTLQDFTHSLSRTEADWRSFLSDIQIGNCKKIIVTGDFSYLKKLKNSFSEDFEELNQIDKILINFSSQEQQIWEKIAQEIRQSPHLFQNLEQKLHWIQRIEQAVFANWISQTERKFPILTEVSTRGYARRIEDLGALHEHKRKETLRYLIYILQKKICDFHAESRQSAAMLRDLHHQVGKKRRLWTVRKLIQETWNQGLSTLLPCWLASPESISAIFPMHPDFFDLVIFDEASQCFVERALPVMLRGKQILVAGDNKQLKPFDMYQVRYDEGEFVETETALEVESVLDLAQTHWEKSHLKWHYRSAAPALIQFSNQHFYENQLQMLPSSNFVADYHPPLEWIQTEGVWEKNRNEVEALKVLELIEELVQRSIPPSIGIVTFNYFQQELIKDLIDKRLNTYVTENPQLYHSLQDNLSKTENEEFVGLFVKNIESVQGDERDVIIFSVGYAPSTQGKISAQFGSLNLAGGENRLNVAITRAKQKIYLICSFSPHQLETEHSKHEGPKLLRKYLEYVQSFSKIEQPENHVTDISVSHNVIARYFSDRLREKGYFVVENYGSTQYKIDLAVKKNADSPHFLLAIECEGENYFSGNDAKEREIYRRHLLQQRGWHWHRVCARNFCFQREKEWNKIEQLCEMIFNEPKSL